MVSLRVVFVCVPNKCFRVHTQLHNAPCYVVVSIRLNNHIKDHLQNIFEITHSILNKQNPVTVSRYPRKKCSYIPGGSSFTSTRFPQTGPVETPHLSRRFFASVLATFLGRWLVGDFAWQHLDSSGFNRRFLAQ